MKAIITITTKNGKNGKIHSCSVASIEDARAWTNENAEYISKQKQRKNVKEITLMVRQNFQTIHFETL